MRRLCASPDGSHRSDSTITSHVHEEIDGRRSLIVRRSRQRTANGGEYLALGGASALRRCSERRRDVHVTDGRRLASRSRSDAENEGDREETRQAPGAEDTSGVHTPSSRRSRGTASCSLGMPSLEGQVLIRDTTGQASTPVHIRRVPHASRNGSTASMKASVCSLCRRWPPSITFRTARGRLAARSA